MKETKYCQRLRTLALLLLILHASLFALHSYAQTEPEYRAEIGAGLGTMGYLGDLNGNLLKNLQPMGSLVARYKMNPRMAVAMSLSYGKLKASASSAGTWDPSTVAEDYSFSYSLFDIGARYEYNFWPYGTGREYRGAQPLTPYITLGVGGTYASARRKVFTANIPMGFGVKYKVGPRWNLGLEWLIHFSLSDELDGVKDPYGIESKGAFKNTDCYTTLQVSLTYDLWAKCKVCHNDKE